jgi:hypothetical protein
VELNRKNFRARLLVKCVTDDTGARIFTDDEAAKLGEQPADVLDRVFAVAQQVNGMTQKDVEDLAKNSDSAPNDASGTT